MRVRPETQGRVRNPSRNLDQGRNERMANPLDRHLAPPKKDRIKAHATAASRHPRAGRSERRTRVLISVRLEERDLVKNLLESLRLERGRTENRRRPQRPTIQNRSAKEAGLRNALRKAPPATREKAAPDRVPILSGSPIRKLTGQNPRDRRLHRDEKPLMKQA